MTSLGERIRLVLGALPVAQRPDSRLMGEWLSHRVKHFRKLERYIEHIREFSSGSSRRDFDFLWGKIQDVLVQDREDANMRSMLGYLAPSAKKPKGAAAKADAIPPPPKPPTYPCVADPKWLLRQRRRKPRLMGFLRQSFRQRQSQRRNQRPSQFQMRKRPRFLASFIVCPMDARMGVIASIVMRIRRVVASPRVSPKGRKLLPKARVDRLLRLAAARLCKLTAGSGPEYTVEWAADTAAGRHLGSHRAKGFLLLRSSPAYVQRIVLLPSALEEGRNPAFKRFP